jgi:Ankyrin repeats (3 copies)
MAGRRDRDLQAALFDAVERRDLELARLLLERGAERDEDAFYHACEQGDTAFLDLLHAPGLEDLVNHKLDFEDAAGLRWFLDRGVDVNRHRCLHHAIARGRGLRIIEMLLDTGADPNLPWDRWDVGRRPLALAARCGHLAAYDLLAARGATAELDAVDAAVLAVARGESVTLPQAPPPSAGSSASSRSWAAPRSCDRSSMPGCPSTPAAGATSRRSTRPPCTGAPGRSGC